MKNKPELLAPAGDMERLKIALLYGADAVYVGGTLFSLRANAINFTLDELEEATKFTHSLHKRIYVTVNIALHDKEIKELKNYLKELERIGVDAIIVSDPAVLEIAHSNTKLDIHLSTQQSTLNYEAIKFWKKAGVTRIVMGREVSHEELEEIKKNVDIEIEVFIHGAMCASYSGRCVLSNYFTGRDSNRGGCAQICRWDFDLYGDDKLIQGDKKFTFCTNDLSMLKYIPNLVDMNITSFKIEGRMRSVYYIASIVNIYRKVIDDYCSNNDNYVYNIEYEKELRRCASRDSLPQFFNGTCGMECQYYNNRAETSNQDFLGIVLSYDNNIVTIQQRNYFEKGYEVEFFGPNLETFTYTIDEIYDTENNLIDVVRHPKQIVKIKMDKMVSINDMMRLKRN